MLTENPLPAYERTGVEPPAPVAYVRIVGPSGQTAANVPLLIDSGADITVIPAQTAHFVGAVPYRTIQLESYAGTGQEAEMVQLTVGLLNFLFSGAYVILEGERGFLGRDILNHFALLLDGPHLSWSIQ